MRIISIVGARPQFVKLAVICRAIAGHHGLDHRIIHTGQHYDPAMSAVFFEELGIPQPDFELGVGSGSHGEQTGEMLKRLEPVLAKEKPDWVLLYGDTNSTLAGAVVGAKLGIRLAHVEAGLRSHSRTMPEEINRIVADHLSDLLLCPTTIAVENLHLEGLGHRTVLTGDVMYDAVLHARNITANVNMGRTPQWPAHEFALATVHRAENTDSAERLQSIFRALERISAEICPVVLPLHPRTRKALMGVGWKPATIVLIEPASYFQMLLLEARSRFVLTDSGGVQKEAYFLERPCITLRDETEWLETLENNCNVLAGASEERIVGAAAGTGSVGPWKSIYGDGRAGVAVLQAIEAATV